MTKGETKTFSPHLEEYIAVIKTMGLTIEQVSGITGMRRETLYQWFTRKKNPNEHHVKEVLKKLKEVNNNVKR